jgi:hypothetical protein
MKEATECALVDCSVFSLLLFLSTSPRNLKVNRFRDAQSSPSSHCLLALREIGLKNHREGLKGLADVRNH